MVDSDGAGALVRLVDGDTEIASWPLRRAPGGVDLAAIEALARLQLAARGLGWSIRLQDPAAELRDLLELAGLTDLFADP